MKNTTILVFIVIAVLAIGAFVFTSSGKSNGNNNGVTGNVVSSNPDKIPGEIQKVVLSTKNYNYYPSEVRVKANQPVEITLDKNVFGCLRSFAIKDLGIRQYAKTPEDKITFTPTKKGTFAFSCSMGMGYGKLIVE